ncbi:MAG TPA: GNAT family protein [Acidimicrobiales bacterium]|jgi:RimJ/RimL family protein N-acetyltransferase|nr:GNAT family protein [Acidimicrobiales bacterium]
MRTTLWPLFDLVVRTPRLVLRYPDDELAVVLAELSALQIHDPNFMPFSEPWTDTTPEHRPRGSLKFLWSRRAAWEPHDWSCAMVVIVEDEVVGVQDVMATRFAQTKTVKTGSWLTMARQGQGIGKEMRAAILHLAFEGLGADTAFTSAWHDNAPSQGVTRSLGYEPNGWDIQLRRGEPDRMLHFVLTRERWQERRRDDITIEGLEPCRALFGIT